MKSLLYRWILKDDDTSGRQTWIDRLCLRWSDIDFPNKEYEDLLSSLLSNGSRGLQLEVSTRFEWTSLITPSVSGNYFTKTLQNSPTRAKKWIMEIDPSRSFWVEWQCWKCKGNVVEMNKDVTPEVVSHSVMLSSVNIYCLSKHGFVRTRSILVNLLTFRLVDDIICRPIRQLLVNVLMDGIYSHGSIQFCWNWYSKIILS